MEKVSFQSYTRKKKVFSLAVFFWTNVMAWDLYKTFGQRTILSHIRPTGNDHLKSNYHQDSIIRHPEAQKRLFLFYKNQNYLPIRGCS